MKLPVQGASDREIWVEFIKMIPQLLWAVVAVFALLLLYSPLIDMIEQGGVSNIQIWQLKFEFAQKQLAEAKDETGAPRPGVLRTPEEFKPFQERIKRLAPKTTGATLLWVDDNHPFQNTRERRAFSALGITIDAVTNTEDAIKFLRNAKYDVVITDLNRQNQIDNDTLCGNSPDVKGAGCGLLQAMHRLLGENIPPAIIYTSHFKAELGTPAYASGVTNRVDHLLNLVLNAIESRKPAL
jgi:CheY-like chemotaxis protein